MKLKALSTRFGNLDVFIGMVKCNQMPELFDNYFDMIEKANLSVKDRSQRLLDMRHVRKIKEYLARDIRVFASPIATCAIDARTVSEEDGLVEITIKSAPHLVDGQKRIKACMLKHQEASFNEAIPVLFVNTTDPVVMQQIFSDTNSTPAKVSPSLSLIFNHVNPLAGLIPQMIKDELLESEKTTVAKKSTKLVTPAILREAAGLIFNMAPTALEQLSVDRLAGGWATWQPYVDALVSSMEKVANDVGGMPSLRDVSILPHNVCFLALTRLIPLMHAQSLPPETFNELVSLHQQGLTHRSNPLWVNRCISFGAMKKNSETINKTAAMLGVLMKIELDNGLALFAPTSQDDAESAAADAFMDELNDGE